MFFILDNWHKNNIFTSKIKDFAIFFIKNKNTHL